MRRFPLYRHTGDWKGESEVLSHGYAEILAKPRSQTRFQGILVDGAFHGLGNWQSLVFGLRFPRLGYLLGRKLDQTRMART